LHREAEFVGGFGLTIEKEYQDEVKCRPAKAAKENAPAVSKLRAVVPRKVSC
jgi:hypothetical protein